MEKIQANVLVYTCSPVFSPFSAHFYPPPPPPSIIIMVKGFMIVDQAANIVQFSLL